MQNRDEDEGTSAAEQAFDALRAEVAGMRRALQALPEWILKNQPADTTETLGAIAQKLETLGGSMAAIEQHPAIRTTPAQYRQAIATAGEGLITQSVLELDRAKAATVAERRELAAMIGTLRGRWKQGEWLISAGLGAFFFGLLVAPLFARALPFGWDGEVAAFILNADRWEAGAALMRAHNPEAWKVLMAAEKLTADNAAGLWACREAAAKTKKEQHCSIVVPAP